MNIYLASSWKHPVHDTVVIKLREYFSVYDYRHPDGPHGRDAGFSWKTVDPNWENWTFQEMVKGLLHPMAQAGYSKDARAVHLCDVGILLAPSGNSAHLELGVMIGADKPCFVYYPEDLGETRRVEPELMYLFTGAAGFKLVSTWGTLKTELLAIQREKARDLNEVFF